MDFWNFVWLIVLAFAFIAYLMVMFSIIGDLFRDHETSGVLKAVWIIFLILAPFLTALVYLIARGKGMAERQMKAAEQVRSQQQAYVRDLAGTASPAEQIAKAKELHDAGVISDAEFESLKAKALA